MTQLQHLTEQMGLSLVNCHKVMTICVQLTAIFGAKPWWEGEQAGTSRLAKELQVMANQEAQATTGCFCTTNQGTLAMEARLRPATTQLENR